MNPRLIRTEAEGAELLRHLRQVQYGPVCLDTETSGLDPWRGDYLVGISMRLSGVADTFYLPIRHGHTGLFGRLYNAPDQLVQLILAELRRLDTKVTWIGWNLPFDWHFLNQIGVTLTGPLHDAQVLWHLIDERPSNKLATRASLAGLDITELERQLRARGGPKKIFDMDPEGVVNYACGDAWATMELYDRGLQELPDNLGDLWGQEAKLTQTITAMEHLGMPVDLERTAQLADRCQVKMRELTQLFRQQTGRQVNMASPQQVSRALGVTNTDKTSLRFMRAPAAGTLAEYRKWHKLLTSFLTPILTMAVQERVHARWNQVGTQTGRWSCSGGLNLQALPRNSSIYRVRECVRAAPGTRLVFWDYAQAEIRLVAHYSQDASFLAVLRANGDVHGQTAREIFGESFTKPQRQVSKTANFAAIYGVGAKSFLEQLQEDENLPPMTLDDSAGILRAFRNNHPAIFRTAELAKARALRRGYIKLWNGRLRRYVPGDQEAAHAAWSNLIQGAVAEIIKTATLRVEEMLGVYGGRLILQVHDELVAEVPEEHVQSVAIEGVQLMGDFPQFSIPIVVDAASGIRWSDKEALVTS